LELVDLDFVESCQEAINLNCKVRITFTFK